MLEDGLCHVLGDLAGLETHGFPHVGHDMADVAAPRGERGEPRHDGIAGHGNGRHGRNRAVHDFRVTLGECDA